MKLLSFGSTDTGRSRPLNEDAFLMNDAACLYAVADGIGGHEGGEIASRIAIETLFEVMPDMLGDKARTPPVGFSEQAGQEISALRYALLLANKRIRDYGEHAHAIARMGTTLTALLFAKSSAFLAHIGDSRAYRMRERRLEQLSKDHSVVAEQVRAGTLRPEQARTSSYRHVITRALGVEETIAPEITSVPLLKNDIFLLCTDGLTEMVSDGDIERILSDSAPRTAVGSLIDMANQAGGADNITAVVVHVQEI
jgi:protein phosphatase